jgi:hypothetical protein
MPTEWTPDDVNRLLVDPRYCLCQPPVVEEERWVEAGVQMIEEMGAEAYLRTLLKALKNDVPYGFRLPS